MKRRIISLLMAALMLVSLAPFGAVAAFGDTDGASSITVSVEPVNPSVAVGGSVTFIAKAEKSNMLSKEIKYLWIDATEIQSSEKLSFTEIVKIASMLLEGKALSESNEYSISSVTAEDNDKSFRCIAYCGEFTVKGGKNLAYAISDAATLTVTDAVPTPTATPEPSTSPVPTASPSACTHANLEHHPATANNTCDPHIEYWYCPDCREYFTDAECKNSISHAKLDDGMTKNKSNHTDIQHFIAKAATCTTEGNIEYWYCSGCDNYYSDADGTAKTTHAKVTTSKTAHDYYWVADTTANVHYQKCRVCDKTTATSSHTGGTASCKYKAECSKCGAAYGELDPDNHINFEYKNAVKPTATTKGYTGDKYCADCGAFIEKGTEYAPQCSGGCKDLKLVKGTPKTCTADGTIDYYQCPTCQNKYKDEKGTVLLTEEDLIDKCTGHDLHPGTSLFANISKDNLEQFAKELGMSTPDIVEMIRSGTFSMENIIGSVVP